jgi:hypothetical protein
MGYLSFLLSVCLVCFLHLGQCLLSSSLSTVLVLFFSVRKLNLLHREHFKPVSCLGPFFAMMGIIYQIEGNSYETWMEMSW